jgi:hypothetical protein
LKYAAGGGHPKAGRALLQQELGKRLGVSHGRVG